jgi:hypothetical protein
MSRSSPVESKTQSKTASRGSIGEHRVNGNSGSLPESLDRRWLAYALAAGAGVLGASQPAQAGIVYTPADIYFTSGSVFIDLNHDGTNDFKFVIGSASRGLKLTVSGNLNSGAGVVGRGQSASALASGALIGPHAPFLRVKSKSALMAQVWENSSTETSLRGKWGNAGDKYLGLRFDINGQAHYGWAEFKVVGYVSFFSAYLDSTLLGYAYDTVANQAIKAGQTTSAPSATPEPATLGLLALGFLGLAAWRRRKLEPVA